MRLTIDMSAGNSAFSGDFSALLTGVLQQLRGDLGVTSLAGVATAWSDTSGNGINVTPGTGAASIGATTGALNGHATVASDAATQYGKYAFGVAPPENQPLWFYGVVRLTSAPAANAVLIGETSNDRIVFSTGGSGLVIYAGVSFVGPAAVPVGTWGRLFVFFKGDGTGTILFGGGSVISGNPGLPGSPTNARSLFANSQTGGGLIAAEIATLVTGTGTPSIVAADAAVTAWFGAGLV